jgi:hypothetical protein
MRKDNKLYVKRIIMNEKSALLCSVNIFLKKKGFICRKFLITNYLNYFCRMKKMSIEQMENLNGGSNAGNIAMCVTGVVGMVIAVGATTAITGPIGGWAVASFAFGWLTSATSAGVGCGMALEHGMNNNKSHL